MSKIKKLAQDQIQKIAAGEVVERPANIVKELLENSIDAGSNQINIFIEKGGKQLIKIVDNGSGMSIKDAKMCIEHHATSKVTKVEDLESILTFGFRGEALSSISAVSKLTIKTKEQTENHGIELEIDNTQIISEQIISCNTGTTIEIHDLFYNLPVRKKFLKTNETEWRNIVQLFYAFTLHNLNISFKLYHDNKLIYNCPEVNNILSRLTQIYGPNLSKNMLELECNNSNINLKLSGAISDPSIDRYDRRQIFFRVNKRWVKNHGLAQAVIKGYQGILQPKKYPSAFLLLDLDPKLVDINVHPKKEEVLFLHPKIVENFIANAIKDRLEKYHSNKINFNNFDKTQSKIGNQDLNQVKNNYFKQENYQNLDLIKNKNIENIENAENKNKDTENIFASILDKYFQNNSKNTIQQPQEKLDLNKDQNIENKNINNQEKIQFQTQSDFNYKFIGQLLNTYILIENNNELILIDQHAAHERILYEELKNNFKHIAQIQLLFPEIVKLNIQDIELIEDYLDILEDCGIKAKVINSIDLGITHTPIILKNQSISDLIKLVLSLISESKDLDLSEIKSYLIEKIHAQMSCKAAVKAGDVLAKESMKDIISKLYLSENKLTCPHGRPTVWSLTKAEIEKKFKRDYKSKN